MNNRQKIKLTTIQRLDLYNFYEGKCAFCGKSIDYDNMVTSNITGYSLPSCKLCSNSSYRHDLNSFRKKIYNRIVEFYNGKIGGLIRSYSEFSHKPVNKIIFYFEKEENKPYLHYLSIEERMRLLSRDITIEELISIYKLPNWCNCKDINCNKWLNLKIFTKEDCKNCKFKKGEI